MAATGAVTGEQQTDVRLFAVTNVSELVERLAYYGVLSVTALYLAAAGYSTAVIGVFFSVLLPLPYVVPMVAGPLASKVGYKPLMLLAFVAYAAGFLLLAVSSAAVTVLGGIVLIGVGAGVFKPLTAASIGLVTSPKHRNLGYTIYYVGINVGGFAGPLLIAAIFRALHGADGAVSASEYRVAFLAGAAVIAIGFLLILTLFRNPIAPQPALSVAASFRPLADVLRNGRFLVLLAIFAGFWMLYSMNFTFVILYLQDYVELPSWFGPSYQVSLESLCVILLGVPLGALATRMQAVPTMAVGIALLTAGFAIVGLFPVFWVFVLGILLVAAGEVLAYPGFLAYVSRIAPPDQVATYQGYGFLPLFAGFLLGPLLGGLAYETFVEQGARPALFWTLMCCLGLVTLAALLLYARWIRPKEDATPRRKAAAAWPVVPLVVAVLLVGAGLAAGQRTELVDGGGDEEAGPLDAGAILASFDGSSEEGATAEQLVQLPAGAGDLVFTLEWSDEAAASPLPGATNQPDTFELEVEDRFGTVLGSVRDTADDGSLVVEMSKGAAATELRARITLTSAGDTVFLGQTAAADTANDWTLTVTVAAAS